MELTCNHCTLHVPRGKAEQPEVCEDHYYCVDCFDGNVINANRKINCEKCLSYFNPKKVLFSISTSDECYYCDGNKDLIFYCRVHAICHNCISETTHIKKIEKCFFCSKIYRNGCKGCFKILTPDLQIKSPYHPDHIYCSSCFITSNLNPNECSKYGDFFSYKNSYKCILCGNIDAIELLKCSDHYFCSQCVFLINNRSKSAYYQFIKCARCQYNLEMFNPQELVNKCRVCTAELSDFNKIIVPTCKYSHFCCDVCFKKNNTAYTVKKNKISCEFCRDYFLKTIDKHACIFCKKRCKEYISTDCGTHNLCINCSILITESENKLCISSLTCNFCSIGLRKKYIENQTDVSSIMNICGKCNKRTECPSYCPQHNFCFSCIKSNKLHLLFNSKNCEYCVEINQMGCRKCLMKIINPEARIKNFYCNKCFINYNNSSDGYNCNSCKSLYNRKSIPKNLCLICQSYDPKSPIKLCEDHYICAECNKLINPSSCSSYISIITCEICKYNVKNSIQSLPDYFIAANESNGKFNNPDNMEEGRVPEFISQISNNEYQSPNNFKAGLVSQMQLYHPAVQSNIYAIVQTPNIQSYQSIPSTIQLCTVHEIECESMECSHPLCYHCFAFFFWGIFNKFIQKITAVDLVWLNQTDHSIGCYWSGCYNKTCIPFDRLVGIAYEILNSMNLNIELADYYSLCFEGIPMEFYRCQKCTYVKRVLYDDFCLCCKLQEFSYQ
jgi:hypothetical protein